MLYPERIGVFRNGLETRDERVGESVGNLERNAQQHREDEEDSHLPLLEEQESVQAQRLHQRFPGTSLAHRTARQRVGIERQQQSPHRTGEELHVIGLEAQQIHQPHGADEPDGTEGTDGRESLDGIQPRLFEGRKGHRVGESQGRHIESDTQRIEQKERTERHLTPRFHGIIAGSPHKKGGQQMAHPQQALGRHPAVGNDTQDSRHEKGNDSLHGIKNTDVTTQANACQVRPHRGQIRSPHSKLQEVHYGQSDLNVHRFVSLLCFFSFKYRQYF